MRRPSKHILLIQYDDILARTLKEILEMMNYAPTLAFDGKDAVGKVEAGYQPDIVMLDFNRPGLEGSEAIQLLRDLKPSLPVLLTTSRVDRLIQDFAKTHQGVGLLAKPFTMAELRYHLAEFS